MTPAEVAPLDVPCPTCAAAAGARCEAGPTGGMHVARTTLAGRCWWELNAELVRALTPPRPLVLAGTVVHPPASPPAARLRARAGGC